jgi:hypothetical protein
MQSAERRVQLQKSESDFGSALSRCRLVTLIEYDAEQKNVHATVLALLGWLAIDLVSGARRACDRSTGAVALARPITGTIQIPSDYRRARHLIAIGRVSRVPSRKRATVALLRPSRTPGRLVDRRLPAMLHGFWPCPSLTEPGGTAPEWRCVLRARKELGASPSPARQSSVCATHTC